MLTVGVDPNWQEDKLTRLMTAIQLVKQRREQRQQDEEKKASRKMELILSAAQQNPSALTSDTVRQFVTQNSDKIPGLQEWYALETATLNDPNSPKNAYDKLLSTADSYAAGVEQTAQGGAPGPFGAAFKVGGQLNEQRLRQHPETAFDAAAASMKPSERLRAQEYAQKTGVDLPLTDPTLRNKKVDGALYVASNPDQYPPNVVKAAEIMLHLRSPAKDPNEHLDHVDYILAHPGDFPEDVVKHARIEAKLENPPTAKEKKITDGLPWFVQVLQDPAGFSKSVVGMANAEYRNSLRLASGKPPGAEGQKPEKPDKLTLNQSDSSIEQYLSNLYERHSKAGLKSLSLGQRRKAAQLFRDGGDVDTFVINSVLPVDGRSLRKVVNYYLRMSKRAEKGAGDKLERSALDQIKARQDGGMSPDAARASVLNELLERALTDRSEN